jgi:arginine N-succinyltransferase
VGAQTRGVEKMLRRVGFRYAWRVDPFDGGPHFTAVTDEVTLVRASHAARVVRRLGPGELVKTRALVAVERAEPPFFEATTAPWRREAGTEGEAAAIGPEAAERLGIQDGDTVWILPLE